MSGMMANTMASVQSRRKCLYMWCLTLVVLLTQAVDSVQGCQYANLDSGHTMCIFKSRMCSGKRLIKTGGLSCMDKDAILMTHNNLRQQLALGRVKGQPAALNMETLVWNDELAMVAQRWADQCMPGHDRSRNIGPFTVGQNVAAVWTYERDEGTTPDFKTQIEAWFNEVMKQGFSKSNIEPFRYSKVAGHYTQLAWAETYLVGCGFTYYFDKKLGHTKLYVCNYAPGGNVVGGTMYKSGYPGQMYCTPHGLQPNLKIQGLCVRDDIQYHDQCMRMEPFMSPPPLPSSVVMTMNQNSPPTIHPHVTIMSRMTPPPPPRASPPGRFNPAGHFSPGGTNFNRFMSHGMPMPTGSFESESHNHNQDNDYDNNNNDDNDYESNDNRGEFEENFQKDNRNNFHKGVVSPFKKLNELFHNPFSFFNIRHR